MKALTMLLLLVCITSLSACVVRPAPGKTAVKTAVMLDKEHSNTALVVVHAKPAKTRTCWQHAKHWHCKK
ncbi:hypothetical protein [Lacimicrobium sp. SS2-24]|uniref:hypothetical protein n=1 Tax=Lacimicrobium sp. SS2-24 TaxID=2005569 RepID=UPI000B4A660A|nr:hypothetical protein [Lacimicrobium sp. SS2-24]